MRWLLLLSVALGCACAPPTVPAVCEGETVCVGDACSYGRPECEEAPPPSEGPGRWIPVCSHLYAECEDGVLHWTWSAAPSCSEPNSPPLCPEGHGAFCVWISDEHLFRGIGSC